MKRVLFQLFNLMMACAVLLSSTGFGLVEHSCQMRGKKTTIVVAFSEVKSPKGCALGTHDEPSTQTVLKKTECCQNDQRYENVDISSSLSQHLAKFVKIVTETILTAVSVVLTWLAEQLIDRKASIADFPSPPSPSGRDILTLVHSLLI